MLKQLYVGILLEVLAVRHKLYTSWEPSLELRIGTTAEL